jgi:hypothetical protein
MSSGANFLKVAVQQSKVCRRAGTSVDGAPIAMALSKKTEEAITLILMRAGAYARCVLKAFDAAM